ncbi:MAG: hypothetical protein LBM20_02125 [Rikenellaceae bacterium]|jgi:hypothetical protein|nr:hypothetical protein [Rikenellaceae bacterium]
MYRIAPFVRLGRIIDRILVDRPAVFDELVRLAQAENPWFTAENVRSTLTAISEKMLQQEKLTQWLKVYPFADSAPKNIGIVMAGNIPLVGFFDLLCVLVSGHRAYVKLSSKDRALMSRAIRALQHIDPTLTVLPFQENSPVQGVIATGNNNTNRYFSGLYSHIPHLLRGSRKSVALLTGGESEADLRGLSHDVFDGFGMGCRSVSKIFVPAGYDLCALAECLGQRNITHPNYVNAYRHHKILLQMRGTSFIDGGFFLLRECIGFSETLPELIYTPYRSVEEAQQWITTNDIHLQCVVTTAFEHPRRVDFGQAQHPELWDYPDGKDVMAFLRSIGSL